MLARFNHVWHTMKNCVWRKSRCPLPPGAEPCASTLTIKKKQKQLPDLIQNRQKSRLIFFCVWRPRSIEKDGDSARRNERRKSNFDASFKNWRGRSQPEMSNYRPERFPGKRLKTKIASENDLLLSLPVCQLPPFCTNDPRDAGAASGRNSQD